LHKRTENYSGNCAVLPPAKTARQNLGVGIFQDVNVGIGPQVEYQCWSSLNFVLANQKRELFLLRAESYEFSNNSAPLSGFTKLMLSVFVLHILLVDVVNKLVNMCLMEISWISDGGTNPCFSQWLWCKWE
jgi:hypothetical protein